MTGFTFLNQNHFLNMIKLNVINGTNKSYKMVWLKAMYLVKKNEIDKIKWKVKN